MSHLPLSIVKTSQAPKPMNASVSSDGRGKRILIDQVEDRISLLPDDVLVTILKKLFTEDVVKTSVLSRRWENVWKQVPYLLFDMQRATITNLEPEPLPAHSSHVAETITKVINNHDGLLMCCIIKHYSHQCHDGVLETWIHLLTVQKQTRLLSLSNLNASVRGVNLLQLPPYTFSHPKLAVLFLNLYDLNTPHAFNGCHNLRILVLEHIFAEVDVLNTVIASCPSLKVLVLHVMWYYPRACLKIHNDNLKLLHLSASYYVDSIEVSAALLDIFSVDYLFDGKFNFFINAPRLLFTTNYGAMDVEKLPLLNYNITCHAQEKENVGNKFLVNRKAYYFEQLISLAVAVDLMNWKEVEMLRDVLVAWNGIMKELDIVFKDNNVSKEEGESSIGGTQKKTLEEGNLFPNADFRVEVVWMHLNDSSKKQFALASRFITQGTVMKNMMFNKSSVPANEMSDVEAEVAKLMELPRGNEELTIGYF